MSSEQTDLWYIYMVQCANGSLYTGITKDVERRFSEHQANSAKSARYLRGKGPLKLVYQAPAGNHSEALKMEYQFKALTRADKLKLIKQAN